MLREQRCRTSPGARCSTHGTPLRCEAASSAIASRVAMRDDLTVAVASRRMTTCEQGHTGSVWT